MIVPHFPPRLRIMSHLRRWELMPTQRPENVAAHSWYVSVYSILVADLIGWGGPRDLLLTTALLHDVDESVTGEMCSPAKQAVIDEGRAKAWIKRRLAETAPSIYTIMSRTAAQAEFKDWSLEMKAVLKVADRLDSVFECYTEVVRGNKTMERRALACIKALESVWWELPGSYNMLRDRWNDAVVPSIDAHARAEDYDMGE